MSFVSISAKVSSVVVTSPQAAGVSSDAIVAAVDVASEVAGTALPRPRARDSPLPRPRLPLPSTESVPNTDDEKLPPRPRPPRSAPRSEIPRPRPRIPAVALSGRPVTFGFSFKGFFLTCPHCAAWPTYQHRPSQRKYVMIPVAIRSVAESTSPSTSCKANTKSSTVQSGNTSLNTFN